MVLHTLLVTPDYPPPPGGIQTIAENTHDGLEEAGHRVTLRHVDPDDYDRRPADLVPRPRWCYTLPATLTGQFVYLNAVYRTASEAIRTIDPDVVHAMHVRNWPALVAAREQGVPSVLSTYALELGERTLAGNAIEAATAVHAISEFTQSLVDGVSRPSVRTRVIPPSIRVGEYRDAREHVDSGDPGPVVTLARFVDRKNIETVIRAWDRLDPAVRGDRELAVAGDGPNRERLETLAADVDGIRFPGWVNGGAKRDLLARADAFVMVPRRDGFDVEGFGIVYIEAQAAGAPVVGSGHGGAPEAIGDAGIVVDDENDPDEVAGAVRALLTDADRREACLSAAENRIDRFDVPAVTADLVDLYDTLLE